MNVTSRPDVEIDFRVLRPSQIRQLTDRLRKRAGRDAFYAAWGAFLLRESRHGVQGQDLVEATSRELSSEGIWQLADLGKVFEAIPPGASSVVPSFIAGLPRDKIRMAMGLEKEFQEHRSKGQPAEPEQTQLYWRKAVAVGDVVLVECRAPRRAWIEPVDPISRRRAIKSAFRSLERARIGSLQAEAAKDTGD